MKINSILIKTQRILRKYCKDNWMDCLLELFKLYKLKVMNLINNENLLNDPFELRRFLLSWAKNLFKW